MALIPEITRVNKTTDKHGTITAVEYFYKLNYKQQMLLSGLFGDSKWAAGPLAEYTQLIRRILRTNEYSENDQANLGEIRQWYINNKKR